ncbi:hypothetical protein HT664_08600 [Ursidibacter maritimus]|uniref:hypothetical protein n=1 Tax=Ursidibacter maritimus TaxID=1331689 RepID=UPI001C483B46|nr:hypothetical protein [Ursidibacter maritimus]MBV6524778.1 hypothetical protein [Ursidibacter maritimus]
MLKISIVQEPTDFDITVRQPGEQWLRKHPNAKPADYRDYWVKCLPGLNRIYKGICCYYGIFIERATGGETVDHYLPKSKYPHLAYEWENFRYSSIKANSRKGNYLDVIDPTKLPSINTFMLDFSTGELYYDDIYPLSIKSQCTRTHRSVFILLAFYLREERILEAC